MNWLLNRYQDGLLFEVDEGIYTTRYKTLSDANNPDLAFRLCSSRVGSENGLDGFGNILAAFFKEETNANFKGFIIKEMFASNGIHVPAEVPNSWYGENFTFSEDIGACSTIVYANGNDSYEPKKKWFKDKDKDGYHEKGSSAKEQVASPGEEWVEGVSKDEDCDDDNKNRKTAEDCEKCKTSKEDLKKMFPNASDANLETLSKMINKHAKNLGVDSKIKLQHLLSQTGHETGGYKKLQVTESTYWTTASKLAATYSKFTNDSIAATKDSNLYYAKDYLKNSKGVANVAMSSKFGNGNVVSGDGYKYRGRGIMQLTWKDNYQAFQNWYNQNNDPDIDIVKNPDLLSTDDNLAVLSGMWYFKARVIDKISDFDTKSTVDNVTKKINSPKKGLKDRKAKFKIAEKEIDCN